MLSDFMCCILPRINAPTERHFPESYSKPNGIFFKPQIKYSNRALVISQINRKSNTSILFGLSHDK